MAAESAVVASNCTKATLVVKKMTLLMRWSVVGGWMNENK
jgi:hypothetical protein